MGPRYLSAVRPVSDLGVNTSNNAFVLFLFVIVSSISSTSQLVLFHNIYRALKLPLASCRYIPRVSNLLPVADSHFVVD